LEKAIKLDMKTDVWVKGQEKYLVGEERHYMTYEMNFLKIFNVPTLCEIILAISKRK